MDKQDCSLSNETDKECVQPMGQECLQPSVASTVVDLRPLTEGKEPVVLREGAVGAAEVLRSIEGIV